MITGVVQAREARIQLTVRGPNRQEQEVEAIIDTGYTGSLTLSPALISSLGLRWRTFITGVLADGSENTFDVYEATVLWDGKAWRISVFETDAESLEPIRITLPAANLAGFPGLTEGYPDRLLVGMTLLHGHELKVEVRTGGRVTIKRLPRRKKA
jgi:clan AA aspartic protease